MSNPVYDSLPFYIDDTGDGGSGGSPGHGEIAANYAEDRVADLFDAGGVHSWSVSTTGSNPATGTTFLNKASFVEYGKQRFYRATFYTDNDTEFALGVTGAIATIPTGFHGWALGSGDYGTRAGAFYNKDLTTLAYNRDNDSDVDMRVDLYFVAIMP